MKYILEYTRVCVQKLVISKVTSPRVWVGSSGQREEHGSGKEKEGKQHKTKDKGLGRAIITCRSLKGMVDPILWTRGSRKTKKTTTKITQATAFGTHCIWNVKQLICCYDTPASRVPSSASLSRRHLSQQSPFLQQVVSVHCVQKQSKAQFLPSKHPRRGGQYLCINNLRRKTKNNLFKGESLKTGTLRHVSTGLTTIWSCWTRCSHLWALDYSFKKIKMPPFDSLIVVAKLNEVNYGPVIIMSTEKKYQIKH